MQWIKQHKIWTAIIIVVLLMVLGGAGRQARLVSQGSARSTASSANYQLGDTIELGSINLAVLSSNHSAGSVFYRPPAGYEYLNVNVTLTNTGKSQQYVGVTNNMFVTDASNRQFKSVVTDGTIQNHGLSLDGVILPGASKTGWVGFEVPVGDTGLKFRYDASFFNNKAIVVNLP